MSRAIKARNEAPDRIVLIIDGDSHYEKLHQKYLPYAQHGADFFHVCKYLRDAACGICGDRRRKTAFVKAAKDLFVERQSRSGHRVAEHGIFCKFRSEEPAQSLVAKPSKRPSTTSATAPHD